LELEDCDISSQNQSCIAIHKGADPRLRRNCIHHGKSYGIFVYDHGQGTLEDNEIFGNALSGIANKEGGNPVARNNRIHDNQGLGILVYENGLGTFEGNEIWRFTVLCG
jgi:parallel beta-helix repeat protein